MSAPTRGRNILDLVLVNDPLPILSCATASPFSTSDHDSVTLCLSFQVECLPTDFRYNFSKADYEGMNLFLANIDWCAIVASCSDTEECCNTITAIIREAMGMFVPVTKGPRFVVPLFIRQLQNRRAQLHRELKHGNELARPEFQKVRNQYKNAVRNWQYLREQRILMSGNSNALYRYICSVMKKIL